jgi:Holliday junction resolvase
MTIYTFNNCKAIGNIGEQLVLDFLTANGYYVARLSVEHQKKYNYDISAVKNDRVFHIEIKTEQKGERTGRIFYETEVDGGLGWCLKYPSDSKVFIFWVFPITKMCFIFPASKLSTIDYTKYIEVPIVDVNYNAKGRLIPISDLETHGLWRQLTC